MWFFPPIFPVSGVHDRNIRHGRVAEIERRFGNTRRVPDEDQMGGWARSDSG